MGTRRNGNGGERFPCPSIVTLIDCPSVFANLLNDIYGRKIAPNPGCGDIVDSLTLAAMRSYSPLIVFFSAVVAIFLMSGTGCRASVEQSAATDPVVSITSPALPGFDLARHEYSRVIRLATAALDAKPKTVVAVRNPRSAGGPHDFSSEGDYWWPDPKNPDGPYIQRDGESNPGNFVAHRLLLMEFSRNVCALAAAYKLTGDDRYAADAAAQLRAWFANPGTRMNPSLLYSQAIKGRFTGRGVGVIDTLHLAEVALAAEAIRGAKSYTGADDAAVTGWFRDYLDWICTHKYGIDESNAKNNHGTCWTLQAACFARLVGDQAVLDKCVARLTKTHIPDQMAADGSFPQELRRTKPYGYSIFNLDVMAALAQVLGTKRLNLMTWRISDQDDRGMIKAVAWLAPWLADKSKWPFKQDVMYWNDWPVRQPSLIFGAMAAGNKDWLALWKNLDPDCMVEEVQRNFPVRQPVLWY